MTDKTRTEIAIAIITFVAIIFTEWEDLIVRQIANAMMLAGVATLVLSMIWDVIASRFAPD